MSKTAKMIIDKDFKVSQVDDRIYGSARFKSINN